MVNCAVVNCGAKPEKKVICGTHMITGLHNVFCMLPFLSETPVYVFVVLLTLAVARAICTDGMHQENAQENLSKGDNYNYDVTISCPLSS